MHESGKDVGKWAQHVYEHNQGGGGTGAFSGFTRNSLEGTGVLHSAGGGQYVRLTEMGHKFAEWLIGKGRKCDYFWSEYGGWGEPKADGFAEKVKKQQAEQKQKEAEQVGAGDAEEAV